MSLKFEDYYQTLGLTRTATDADIKRAYRKLAQKFHPDRNKEAGTAEKFSRINEAYEVLKDPEKRKRYDQLGENWKSGQDFRPPPGYEGFNFRGSSGRASGGGFEFEGEDFSDFFRQMFGQAGGRGRGPFGGTHEGGPFGQGHAAPGPDQQAEITVSLQEVYHGSTRQIALQSPMGRKSIDVKIPAGLKPGSKIRLKGEGLVLKVNVEPDPRFVVDGVNLTTDLKISPAVAALGGKADVQTLDGNVTLTIPPGTSSGSRLRLSGRGLGAGDRKGSLFVRVQIAVPKTLTDEQRALYEKLRDLDA